MKWPRFLSKTVSETLCADFRHDLPLSLVLADLGSAQCDPIEWTSGLARPCMSMAWQGVEIAGDGIEL